MGTKKATILSFQLYYSLLLHQHYIQAIGFDNLQMFDSCLNNIVYFRVLKEGEIGSETSAIIIKLLHFDPHPIKQCLKMLTN